MRRLRIAQISPLFESVPPRLYGGTERVVSHLTEELVRQGHEVTLFASGDSLTSAKLVSCWDRALRLDPTVFDQLIPQILQNEDVVELADQFDILHFHTSALHYNVTRFLKTPQINTMHGLLSFPELPKLVRRFSEIPLVSISNHQRLPLPKANWLGTVYHGLPKDLFKFNQHPDDYVAFLGRISPEKRVDRAIEIAGRCDIQIKIAAKIDTVDRPYFEREIESLFRLPHVNYIGEIGETAKNNFLGRAKALLFPIDWPEPFGLVMIEAMACGTPVIAFRNGSVPEILVDGENGYIVDTIDEAVVKLKTIDSISRERCRALFEERFTNTRMATDYVKVYERVLETQGKNRHTKTAARAKIAAESSDQLSLKI